MKNKVSKNDFYTTYMSIINKHIDMYERYIMKDTRSIKYHHDTINSIIGNANIIYNGKAISIENPINVVINMISIDDKKLALHLPLVRGFLNVIRNLHINIRKYKTKLKELRSYIIDRDTYMSIYSLLVDNIIKYIIKGNAYNITSVGRISIIEQVRRKKSINWNESNKYKAYLESIGKTPYKKEEALLAIANCQSYDGVHWYIYYDEPTYPFFRWQRAAIRNASYYTLKLLRYNNTGYSTDKVASMCDKFDDLFKFNISPYHKMHVAFKLNKDIYNTNLD